MSEQIPDPLDAGNRTCLFCGKRLNHANAIERLLKHGDCLMRLIEEDEWAKRFAANPSQRTAVGGERKK